MSQEIHSSALFDQLPIRVTVEIGTVDIDYKTLKILGDGSILQVDRKVSEPAILKANGVPFALGEIVTMDDQLAVKVTEVFDENTAKQYEKYKEIVPYKIKPSNK